MMSATGLFCSILTAMKKLLILAALALPVSAFAFDYVPHTTYRDVHASSKEAAAINMLTNEGAAQGYYGGLFLPSRRVNRAEFLKLALGSAPNELVDGLDSRYFERSDCFDDVKADDWFNMYVCYAKQQGLVEGYPMHNADRETWSFKPVQHVTYAQALKILTLIYGYELDSDTSKGWEVPYYHAAAERGVDLPITITFDSPLTRGQVARLAAAFLAESQGKLVEYRMAESGILPDGTSFSVSSSSSSSSAPASSSSSSAPSVSSSSSASTQALFTLPSVSHFLLSGMISDAIGDGVIRHNNESAHIRSIEVKLFQEVIAIDTLKVFTDQGVEVATLQRMTTTSQSDYKQTYNVQLAPGNDFAIPANKDVRLVVRANIRGLNNNGASNQLLQMRSFSVTVQSDISNQTTNFVIPAPFPIHQTSFGHLTSVRPLQASGVLASGSGMAVVTYTFTGSAIPGRQLFVENLIFTSSKSDKVETGTWSLSSADGTMSVGCSVGSDGISCLNIPASMGLVKGKGLVLILRTNVTVPSGATGEFLQAELAKAGSTSELGSVHWTDEAGHFRWVEAGVLQGQGTRWSK